MGDNGHSMESIGMVRDPGYRYGSCKGILRTSLRPHARDVTDGFSSHGVVSNEVRRDRRSKQPRQRKRVQTISRGCSGLFHHAGH
jgi:hypothetical protein